MEDTNPSGSDAGTFSVANITSFLTSWWGSSTAPAPETRRPDPTPEQQQSAAEAEKAASSWNVDFSSDNFYDALLFGAKQLSTIVPQPAEDVKSDLSLQGFKLDAGDAHIEIEAVRAEKVGYALIDVATWDVCVFEMDKLTIGRVTYASHLIDVEGSLDLKKLRLKVGASEVVAGVGAAFSAAMSEAEVSFFDTAYDLMEHGESDVKGVIGEIKSNAVAVIMTHLRVKLGVSIESIDLKLKFNKFGTQKDIEDLGVTVEQSRKAVMAQHLRELDLDIGRVTVEAELDDDDSGKAGQAALSIADTHLKAEQSASGEVQIEGGTEINLAGSAKARVGDLTAEVVVFGFAALDVKALLLTADTVVVEVRVTGSYADARVELEMNLSLDGVALSASCTRGDILDCVANEVVSAIDYVLKFVVGDGEPTGLTPQQLKATFLTAAVVQVRDALLKQMKLRLDARVGRLSVAVDKFRYGDLSGEAELSVEDLDFTAVLDPEQPVQMQLSAEVLMSGLLQAKDKNLLDFTDLSVSLDERGNGMVTGHFHLHSAGLTSVLGNVLGKASKAISKEADLNVRIANYAVELTSTNLKMSSTLLNPIVSFVLNHVGVNSGPKPALGLTGKGLRKGRIKKLARPADLGQRDEGDAADILIDNKTAKAIFDNPGSKGALNLLGFLQNTVQDRLDALRDWEPDDPTQPKPEPAIPAGPKSPLDIPLTTKKQLKAAKALQAARIALKKARQDAAADSANAKLATKADKAQKMVEAAEGKLIEANMQAVMSAKRDIEKAAAKSAKAAKSAADKSLRKAKPASKKDRYEAEVQAALGLLVNNCLIDAISASAGLGNPDIAQLATIRGDLGNVGEMMLATPRTVAAILKGLGLTGRKVVVSYPAPIPPEVFDGTDPPILVRHTGAAHFVAG